MHAIGGLLQPRRSLEMAKQIHTHVALTDLEIKAHEFISLSFAYCEEQLCRRRQPHPNQIKRESPALAAACLSVQESIKTFLAIARIERE